jgi:hypothetical protein
MILPFIVVQNCVDVINVVKVEPKKYKIESKILLSIAFDKLFATLVRFKIFVLDIIYFSHFEYDSIEY